MESQWQRPLQVSIASWYLWPQSRPHVEVSHSGRTLPFSISIPAYRSSSSVILLRGKFRSGLWLCHAEPQLLLYPCSRCRAGKEICSADSDYSPTLGDICSIHLNNPSRTCCCVVSLPNTLFSLIKEKKSYIFVHKDLPVVFGVPPIKLLLETPGNSSLPSGRRCLCGLPHSFCLVTQFVRTTLFYFLVVILLNFLGFPLSLKSFCGHLLTSSS